MRVFYCSKECQAAAWPDHKSECKKISKKAANPPVMQYPKKLVEFAEGEDAKYGKDDKPLCIQKTIARIREEYENKTRGYIRAVLCKNGVSLQNKMKAVDALLKAEHYVCNVACKNVVIDGNMILIHPDDVPVLVKNYKDAMAYVGMTVNVV